MKSILARNGIRNGIRSIRTFEWKMADHSNAFECLFLGPVEASTGARSRMPRNAIRMLGIRMPGIPGQGMHSKYRFQKPRNGIQTFECKMEASTGPRNGNAQEWHPFIFPFLDKHSKRGMHSKYRFQSLKRYRFHSNGTFKRGLPRGMENGENIRMHSNAFECLKCIRMLEKSPLGGGDARWECWVRPSGVCDSAPEKEKKKHQKKTPDFLIWKDARMITAAWTSHCMSTLTNTLLLQLFSTVKKKKAFEWHSNGPKLRMFECFECHFECRSSQECFPFLRGMQSIRNT